MAKNTVPEAKEALNRFKMEAASEVGVNLKQGYNGDLTSKQAGSVGGQMVNVMCPVRTVQFQRTQSKWFKSVGITYFSEVRLRLLSVADKRSKKNLVVVKI